MLDAKTQLRTKITLLASLEYVATSSFLALYCAVGQVDLSLVWSFVFIGVCNNALFLGCIVSGFSKRFKDPSMTAIQMIASCGRDILGMFLAPHLWYLFAFNLFIALPFGSLQFDKRAFAVTWLCLNLALGFAMLTLPSLALPPLHSLQDRLLLWLFLGGALARLMLFNARVSDLRSRLRKKLVELDTATRQLAEVVARSERERIASELHDTLLQGIYGLLLRLQAMLPRLPADSPLREALALAAERAQVLVDEGRDRVTGLRDTDVPAPELADALRRLAAELPVDQTLRVEVLVQGDIQALKPSVSAGVYGIAREALVNVIRHAHAQRARLRLECSEAGMRLVIDDNGVGIDPTAATMASARGHWGLTGMRERADRIGGRVRIGRAVKGGTRVELRVPSQAAYVAGAHCVDADRAAMERPASSRH
ncbi:sensor histidine kinase [Schlegelella sp. S2-27]|uniref:Sensor histidine kinase n=1 Tax=Caldimonas mangrovi TaxID=2944811 RepID=A0ABT0YNX1_9BURK|nr:sensor histidine kinase [Caldimonas mangrovi]MCM5679578.1 sensor histidine kinase [Caldimonas mangrovi]